MADDQDVPADPTPPSEPPANPQTFSQDDVNRIVADRVKRERAKFGDYDQLRTKAEQFDQLADQSKTELEKAVDRATRETEARIRAEVAKHAAERVARAEIAAAAAKTLADPADAALFIDLADILDKDGELDRKALDKALAQLVKDKPYLAANGARQASGFDVGARGPAPASTDMNTLIRQAAGRGA